MKRPKPTAQTLTDVHSSPGHLMRRSQQIAVAIFFEEVRDFDLTPVQFAALTAIKDNPEIDQRRLVDLIAIDRSTVGTMLQRLEEKRLITRTTPDHNRRIKQLAVTPPGAELLAKARASVERAQERILAPLSAREKKEFMRLLGRLVDINNRVSRVPLKVQKD
jgi:DNA-binding MarR family transcriptional regulator